MKRIPAVTLFIGVLTAGVFASSTAGRGPSATASGTGRQAAGQRRAPTKKPAHPRKPAPAPALPCGDPFAFEVLLDRQNFSPGEIDGKLGTNASHAIAALQAARGLEPTGDADCDTWHALGGDTSGSMIATYTIEKADVKGPFAKTIPADLEKQASLPALSYRSPLERLAERFHVSPALLQRMNRRVAFKAGAAIQVPAVTALCFNAQISSKAKHHNVAAPSKFNHVLDCFCVVGIDVSRPLFIANADAASQQSLQTLCNAGLAKGCSIIVSCLVISTASGPNHCNGVNCVLFER